MHDSVDPDLPVLRNPDHGWLSTIGVRDSTQRSTGRASGTRSLTAQTFASIKDACPL